MKRKHFNLHLFYIYLIFFKKTQQNNAEETFMTEAIKSLLSVIISVSFKFQLFNLNILKFPSRTGKIRDTEK